MRRRPTEHPVDLSNIGERWATRSNPDVVGIPHGHGELPFDLPVMMEVARVMGDFPGDPDSGVGPARGLLGWAVTINCFVIGAEIKLKLYRDPHGFAVEVDGEEVTRRILSRDDMATATAARDQRREVETKFVEAVALEPGDEVIEEDGQVHIVRAEAPEAEDDIEWED